MEKGKELGHPKGGSHHGLESTKRILMTEGSPN